MPVYAVDGKQPSIHSSVYIADNATLIGAASIAERCSFWSGSVVRADNDRIDIGPETNVQECAVIHADPDLPVRIGANVTIGHQAMVHGCTIEDGALIGIHAVVLNGAVIAKNCLVAAGAVVTEGKAFPEGSLIVGAPARVLREVTPAMLEKMKSDNLDYVARAERYQRTLLRIER